MQNPFRNALTTFNNLPREWQPSFLAAIMADWNDLTHNANPIEHEPLQESDAIDYMKTWGNAMYSREDAHASNNPNQVDIDNVTAVLTAWANAFDSIIPELPEDDETTFAGEHVASGQYIEMDIFNDMASIMNHRTDFSFKISIVIDETDNTRTVKTWRFPIPA